MVVLKAVIKAALALVAGQAPLSIVLRFAWKLNASISLMTSLIILTGRFRSSDHKCCILATKFSHKCYLALVAFCCLGYNIYLEKEIL